MEPPLHSEPISSVTSPPFQLGDWQALPAENALVRAGLRVQIEPRCMDVLLCLARAEGGVVPADRLLDECWAGIDTGDNPLHKTIAALRRVLGDSATKPHYIETIRKRGYRILVPVHFVDINETAFAPVVPAMSASPFRGLEPFDADHSGCFFGRDSAVAELMERIARQCENGSGFLLALGASGCGKTSLLHAGLLPRLRALPEGHPARPLAVVQWRPGSSIEARTPWRALAELLVAALPAAGTDAEAVRASAPAASPAIDADWLSLSPEAAITALLARHAGAVPPDGRLYLVIDPFEQLFSHAGITPDVRAAFVAMLATLAACPRVFVLAACRNEFYPQITQLPELMRLKAGAGQYDVPAPTAGELAQMIRHPALAAGLSFEADASGARLDDVLRDAASRGSEVLPLLEYALDELYRSRDARGTLTFAAYAAMGGVEGAIGRRAEQTINQLAPPAQAALGRLMSRLVVIGGNDHVGGRRARFAELGGEVERQLLDALVAARLIVTELVNGEPCFLASHEALFRHWPRVIGWIERHRAALRLRERVAPLVARWTAEGESPDFLLPPGRQLDEAGELLASDELELSAEEVAWLAASVARAARLRRRSRVAIAVLAMLAVVSTALALIAWDARQAAVERRREAEGLMSFMLGTLADKLRPIGRLELLNDVSEQALHFLADTRGDDDLPTRMARARALQVGAEVEHGRGRLDSAEHQVQAALALLPEQPADISAPKLLRLLGELHYWIGQLYYDRQDWPRALAAFADYRACAERWRALLPDDRDAAMELSYALTSLGSIAIAQGHLPDAGQLFQESVALKQMLRAGHEDDDQLAADLGDSLSWTAVIHERQMRFGAAAEVYEQAAQMISTVAARRRNEGDWQDRASVVRLLQAMQLINIGNDAAARDAVRAAREQIDLALAIDAERPEWQRHAAQADCLEVELAPAADAGARRRLRAQAESALRRVMPLMAADKTRLIAIELGRCQTQLARLDLLDGDLARAAEATRRGIELLQAPDPRAGFIASRLWLLRRDIALAGNDDAELKLSDARLAALRDELEQTGNSGMAARIPVLLAIRLALRAATSPADLDAPTRELLERVRASDYRASEFTRRIARHGIELTPKPDKSS